MEPLYHMAYYFSVKGVLQPPLCRHSLDQLCCGHFFGPSEIVGRSLPLCFSVLAIWLVSSFFSCSRGLIAYFKLRPPALNLDCGLQPSSFDNMSTWPFRFPKL